MAKIIIVGAAHGGRETVNGLLAANTDNEIHWYEHGQFATALDWAPTDAEKERLALSQQVTLFDQTTVTKITPATHTITARNQRGQLQTDRYQSSYRFPEPNYLVFDRFKTVPASMS
ncbi:hypothetical protein [Lactiplantibacillus plantarum]|uniref:hypothetical protein n=1 Tax=Lactiplantibacillus plantarum TaxID=1590 RepID=UPI0021CB623A|nr:hypothetical protein [Lactiplantibacillus plantarum]